MGKFDTKRHKDLRDFKSKEIKKSLVHRARLRKNYFKLKTQEQKENDVRQRNEREKMKQITGDEIDEQEDNDDSKGSDDEQDTDITPRVHENPYEQRKQMTFQERSKLAKQRKEENRAKQIEEMNQKKANMDKAKRQRERLNKKLSRTTKSGQPLMGPRITNLLDKIKQQKN